MTMRRSFAIAVACCGLALLTSPARAASCEHAGLASILDRMETKGRLHNCEIELITRVSPDGMRHYLLLVNDLTPSSSRPSDPGTFEFQIDASCASHEVPAGQTFRYSYGFTTAQKDYKAAIQVQVGFGPLPVRLMVQYIDLVSHRVDQRVVCRLDSEEP